MLSPCGWRNTRAQVCVHRNFSARVPGTACNLDISVCHNLPRRALPS